MAIEDDMIDDEMLRDMCLEATNLSPEHEKQGAEFLNELAAVLGHTPHSGEWGRISERTIEILNKDREAAPVLIDAIARVMVSSPGLEELDLSNQLIGIIMTESSGHVFYESRECEMIPSDDEFLMRDMISALDGLLDSYLSAAKDIIEGFAHDPPFSGMSVYPSDIIRFFEKSFFIKQIFSCLDRNRDLRDLLVDEAPYIRAAMDENPFVRPAFIRFMEELPYSTLTEISKDIFEAYYGVFLKSDFLYVFIKLMQYSKEMHDNELMWKYPDMFRKIVLDNGRSYERRKHIDTILSVLSCRWHRMLGGGKAWFYEDGCDTEKARKVFHGMAGDILSAAMELNMDIGPEHAWGLITLAKGEERKDIIERVIRMMPDRRIFIDSILIGGEVSMEEFEHVFDERVKTLTFREHFPLGTVSVTVSTLQDAIWYQVNRGEA